MLPKSKLGRHMLSKLLLYVGPQHPHQAQQPIPLEALDGRPTAAGILYAPPPGEPKRRDRKRRGAKAEAVEPAAEAAAVPQTAAAAPEPEPEPALTGPAQEAELPAPETPTEPAGEESRPS